jgi:hypothetical protein
LRQGLATRVLEDAALLDALTDVDLSKLDLTTVRWPC